MVMFEIVRGYTGAAATLVASLMIPATAFADAVLTLSRDGETVELTRDELKALPQHSLTTTTEFTDGLITFTGPLARDVLDHLGLNEDEMVRMTAMNDYFIEVPTEDFAEYDVIMAMDANGERLSPRDKGPIWLMYPMNEHPELNDPLYHARLIWQLVRVEGL